MPLCNCMIIHKCNFNIFILISNNLDALKPQKTLATHESAILFFFPLLLCKRQIQRGFSCSLNVFTPKLIQNYNEEFKKDGIRNYCICIQGNLQKKKKESDRNS